MISLTKLRLINWHLFSNEKANLDNITFLTGANGTGKSTIIDAIQIVLLGDTTSRNFNKAANEKSGRTLLSYLKGDTGETINGEVSCIRKGRFSSYIVLQFYNSIKKTNFSLGVTFDIYDDNTYEHIFFYINDSFPNNDFIKKEGHAERPLTIKEHSEFLRKNYQPDEYKIFDSNTAYQTFIKDVFGGLSEKFFSLLKKSISFTPITNISKFITEFVCDIDFKIDIEPMKRNIEYYKLLELEAKKINGKIISLNEIQDTFSALENTKQDFLLSDYLSERVLSEPTESLIKEHKKTIEKNASRIEEIISIINEHNNDIITLEHKKELLLAQKIGTDNYSTVVSITAQKDAIDAKINNINLAYQNLLHSLNKYNFALKQNINDFLISVNNLPTNFLNEEFDKKIEDFKENSANILDLVNKIENFVNENKITTENLKSYQLQTSNHIRITNSLLNSIEISLEETSRKNNELNLEISRISEGNKPYSYQFLTVKNELEKELLKSHNDAKVEVYCDLIDIIDKRWTKAIEAAIYPQKFNLFVNNEYYEEADAILKRILEKSFIRVSLVDSQKLIDKGFKAKDGSVASVICTSHEGARAYTNYLLGSIYKCESFKEARECGSGLLPDCTGYRSFSTWYLNKKLADIEYIGTSVGKNLLDKKKEEQSISVSTLNALKTLYQKVQGISLCQVMSSNECENFSRVIVSKKTDTIILLKEKDELNSNLFSENFKDINEINSKISEIDYDISQLSEQKEKLIKEQGFLESESKNLIDVVIPTLIKNANNLKAGLSNKYSEDFINNIAEPYFKRIQSTMSLEKIKNDADGDKKALNIRIGQLKSKLINLRSIYVAANNLNFNSSDENSNKEFDDELSLLVNFELPSYQDKIHTAHKNAIKEFKNDFIYKLRTSIEMVKSHIEELNDALSDVKFGKDSYRFVVSPNKDFIEYYNMITSDLLLNPQSGNNDFIIQFGPVMEELFSLISSSNTDDNVQKAQILLNIEKFTDYRTYLNFDLLVKRGSFPIESSLSRTFKKQSGGETQTPFYIAILASFAQLYRIKNEKNNNTLRLVIFDEAFSKMDSTRIKEVVFLIKSFGLQAILSTPSEKIRDLANSVDLILVTMHDSKKARSYIDRYREIKSQ